MNCEKLLSDDKEKSLLQKNNSKIHEIKGSVDL